MSVRLCLGRAGYKLVLGGFVGMMWGCAQIAPPGADPAALTPAAAKPPDVSTQAPLAPYDAAVAAATDPLSPKRLVLVARYGHEPSLTYLLQNNVDPNVRDASGYTALIAAAEGGHRHIIRLLLDAKADVNAHTDNGKTALMAAATRGDTDIMELLLDAGAEVNARDTVGEAPLFNAVKFGQAPAAQLLLRRGADPNLQNRVSIAASNSGFTPLMYAADHGAPGAKGDWPAMVELLLTGGAQPNVRNNRGDTALSIAERRYNKEVIAALERFGGRVETNYTGLSEVDSLVKAARLGDTEKARSLLDRGAKPNSANDNGVTPLLAATFEGRYEVAALLLKRGAAVDQVPVGLREWALNNSRAPITDKELIESAARGDTALIAAVRRNHNPLVELLLKSKAKPNVSNQRGETPIFVAATLGNVDAVRMLLRAGVDPNTLENEKLTVSMTNTLPSMGRNTPLIAAAQAGHAAVAGALLKAGATVNHQGFLNKTALFWAVDRSYGNTVELLLQNKADPNLNDIEGLTPLIVAARNGNARITQMLLEAGAEPNVAERADVPGEGGKAFGAAGMTALIYASRAGHQDIVTMLIKAGANVNAASERGETALKEANTNGHGGIVKMLKMAGAQ